MDSNKKMDAANDANEKASSGLEKTLSEIQRQASLAESKIIEYIRPLIRGFVLANYNKSGIKTQSGKLKNAIENLDVKLILFGKKPRISIFLPASIPDYKENEGGGNFYKAASAVNYGAVRNNNEKNKRRRKALKNQTQKNSKKENWNGSIVTSGQALTGGKKNESGTVEYSDGTTVTKAYNFWELTSSQKDAVRAAIMRIFNQEVFGE